EADEIIKNEGDPLVILCSGPSKIFFFYPTNSGEAINTSAPDIKEYQDENGIYTYEFRRPKTVFGDTGWYGCSDHLVEVTTDSYFDPEINWVYVYVQSDTNLFVEADTYESLRKISGSTVIIPCRPTSPNLTVNLSNDEVVILFNKRYCNDIFSFDPRIGFTLKNLTLKDSAYYKCVIERDGIDHEVNYHLLVFRKHTLTEPKILEDTLRHVTRGQTLYVNCTIDVNVDMHYVLNWSTPQQSNRISTRLYSTTYGSYIRRATNELTIRNMTDDDEGLYACIITNFQDSKKSEKYIKVYDPGNKFLNLTAQDSDRHYQRRFGDKVQWVVYVNAYPEPTLKWLNPKGEVMTGNWASPEKSKFAINTTPLSTMTILRINHLDVNDMGVYSIQATNDDRIEVLNFTLDVIAKPIPILERIESYYAPNQEAEMRCHVAAYPEPEITWNFLKCPNYPSCENGTIVNLTETKEHGMTTFFLSIVRMMVEMSGRLTCKACNVVGCDSVTENVFVSDGNGGFGIIEPKESVTEGDDLELICAASVYNYSNIFEWSNEDNTPILETNRLSIVRGQTQFTYRSILRINNVEKQDSKYYICTGRTTENITESMDYDLRVQDARAPTFEDTNLKQNEVTIDSNTQGHKTVILKCFADGMPKPNITWYKDDTMLMTNEQYMFLYNYQELHIKYLLESDSGKYLCRVENRMGKLEAYQQITIKGKELPKELIILIIILVIIVVILVIYFTIKVRREKIMRKELMEAGLMHFEEGAIECLNPDLTVDDQAELLPYDKKWEFPRERLKLGELLVIVEYCRFGNLHNYLLRHRGDFINQIDPSTGKFDPSIGIDILTRTASVGSNNRIKYAALSFSRSISGNSGTDSVHYQGTAMDSQGVIMTPYGCVLSNGSSQPGWRSNYRGDYKDHNLKPICTQDLLSWAFQVARGMEYLSQRKVLHGDLAARNILLAENNVVKICDFGLAKTMYKDDNYKKKGDGPLPIKWMAIESIRDRIFSTQSDIWSFGIVLWEFFTLAETPYPGMEAEKQYQKLIEGYRMEQPEYATFEVYDIMLQCWKAKPTVRPSFTELVDSIGDLLEESVKAHYVSLNDPYMDMNTTMLEGGKNDYLTMLSAPDHTMLSSPNHDYVNSPVPENPGDSSYLCMSPISKRDESGIFSPRSVQERTHFDFPSPTSDSEDAVEMSPMLKKVEDDDPYLK
ncbi:Vascular endothelial growth factor receptor 3, partial [Dufourea novaeangliae]